MKDHPDPSADIMARLDRMAEISESPRHLTRRCFTPEHRQINDLVCAWMRDAGMEVREDALGNVIGRYEGRVDGAPAIMLGSHVDTVIMAGKYDGGLGILSAIDCVRSLNDRGIRFDCAIEVAGFSDEEGVRFQSTYLGSRALAGTFDPGLLGRPDKDGVTLADAMGDFGLDPQRIRDAVRKPGELICYLEVHIEQGPVLEDEGLAVGAVSAISGANRMTVTVEGTAGHAGTVPMSARRDALAAACECVMAVEQVAASRPNAVGTVGQISVAPGATNVIPGRVTFSVDLRAADDAVRRSAVGELEVRMQDIASKRSVSVSVDHSHSADGVVCAPWIVSEIEMAMRELGHPPRSLPSGAGHDAAALAEITDVGMIFVRCAGGISHSPDESITEEDAKAGAHLLLRVVERIGASRS
ncbi:MAG TPA: allantoate amidohydrolase [Thermohalobaculum sp.]|nr:allantoate amidohydrolase [Thermohalobaculum sp.]